MKKIIALLMAILMVAALAACAAKTETPAATEAAPEAAATEAAPEAAPEAAAPAEEGQLYVEPLPAGIDPNNLTDCMVPVTIRQGAIVKGEDGTYTAELDLFNMDLYDAVDFSRLKEGDMMLIEGSKFVISSITQTDYGTNVKGQFAVSGETTPPEDGYDFISNGGGTMRIQGFDDHATYTYLGTPVTKVAENFTVVDSAELDKDPVTLTGEEAIAALQNLERSFVYLNTTATYEGGVLTQIDVVYMP